MRPQVNGMPAPPLRSTKPGKVEISAASEPAVISNVFQFDASNEGAAVTLLCPRSRATPDRHSDTHCPYLRMILFRRMVIRASGMAAGADLALFGGALLTYWAAAESSRRAGDCAGRCVSSLAGCWDITIWRWISPARRNGSPDGGRPRVYYCLLLGEKLWGFWLPGCGCAGSANQSREQADQQQDCRAPGQRCLWGML
jgi:hypothetical protein